MDLKAGTEIVKSVICGCPLVQVYCIQSCGEARSYDGGRDYVQHYGPLLPGQSKRSIGTSNVFIQIWFFWKGEF